MSVAVRERRTICGETVVTVYRRGHSTLLYNIHLIRVQQRPRKHDLPALRKPLLFSPLRMQADSPTPLERPCRKVFCQTRQIVPWTLYNAAT
jgi:hypothetical protein